MKTYQNPDENIETRIDDLMSRMTLEEKVHELIHEAPANERLGIPRMRMGEILHGTLEWSNNVPEENAGALPTVFPIPLAMGCCFNPEMIEQAGRCIAREARAFGHHQCYSPNLDIAMDPRFGRVEENFGEDPCLVSHLGVAMIHGFQGRGQERFDARHVLATAKHFAGYGAVRGGVNGAEVDMGERVLREVHLAPFEAAVREAQVAGIMPSHNTLDGVPCHGNAWLLRDVLRDEWGFDGVVVSDNVDVYRLHAMQNVSHCFAESALLGIRAGVDMELVLKHREGFFCYHLLPELVEEGLIREEEIDVAVKRNLRAKFRLGLFEGDEHEDPHSIGNNQEHRAVSLEMAKQCHVLLKNESLLPLNADDEKTIALIGPHGDICEYGGYTGDIAAPGVSPLEALRSMYCNPDKINFERGCTFDENCDKPDEAEMINQAMAAAEKADLVILTLGGTRKTCGEGTDNADIGLPGLQRTLAHAVLNSGKPTALILIGGRPWDVADIIERSHAVLVAWYGGCEAGNAIAQTLFGKNNPGGKLSMSFPKSAGHTQCSYLRRPSFNGAGQGEYRQHDVNALYPFGYGLSYTTFEYSDLQLSSKKIGTAGSVIASVTITNTGDRAGDEVAQCYLTDEVASITPYLKRLCDFQRIHLKPGESQKVDFNIGPDAMALWNIRIEHVVEPGWFTVQVGTSSNDGLTDRFVVHDQKTRFIDSKKSNDITISREIDMDLG
jgi:beta-glucosidase